MALNQDETPPVALLEALYCSIANPQMGNSFLLALADYLGASRGILLFTGPGENRPRQILSPASDRSRAALYADRYFARDPFVGLPSQRVVSFSEFLSRRATSDLASIQGYLSETVGDQILGVDISPNPGLVARLRVARMLGLPDFGQHERARLEALVPHLVIAMRGIAAMMAKETECAILRDVLATSGQGTLVIDRDRRILVSDGIADALIDSRSGLSAPNARLRLSSPAADRRLGACLERLGSKAGAGGNFLVDDPCGEAPMAIAARSIAPSLPVWASCGDSLLLLRLRDPAKRAPLDAATVRQLLPLTPTEAALTAAMAGGETLRMAAGHLGIAYNTARAHLRSIFSKTGVTRQAELIERLRALLPEGGLASGPAERGTRPHVGDDSLAVDRRRRA